MQGYCHHEEAFRTTRDLLFVASEEDSSPAHKQQIPRFRS
jgi:hypothetical protein